jgi:hypothetical protein
MTVSPFGQPASVDMCAKVAAVSRWGFLVFLFFFRFHAALNEPCHDCLRKFDAWAEIAGHRY